MFFDNFSFAFAFVLAKIYLADFNFILRECLILEILRWYRKDTF